MHSTPAAEGKGRPQCFPRPLFFWGHSIATANQRKRSFKLCRVLQHAFHLGTIPGGAQRKQNRVGFLHSQQERGQEDVVVLPRHLSKFISSLWTAKHVLTPQTNSKQKPGWKQDSSMCAAITLHSKTRRRLATPFERCCKSESS